MQEKHPGRDLLAAHRHLQIVEHGGHERMRLGPKGRLAAKRAVLAVAHAHEAITAQSAGDQVAGFSGAL